MIERKYNFKKGSARLSINLDNLYLTNSSAPKKSHPIKLFRAGAPAIFVLQPSWKHISISQAQFKSFQQLKHFYHLSDSQFQSILHKAHSLHSSFLPIIESRLDVLLYRSQFASSIFEARNLIHQKKVKINNKVCIDINLIVSIGSEISIDPKLAINNQFKFLVRNFNPVPNYLLITSIHSSILIKTPSLNTILVPINFELDKLPGAI